jgi:hypothetical protein
MKAANLEAFDMGRYGDLRTLCTDNLGVGSESLMIQKDCEKLVEDYFRPYSRLMSDPQARFLALKVEWEAETAHLSSITEICMHPAYQQIIGMGQEAVPLILAELRRKPGHWFWALRSITGEDPVPPQLRGRMRQMAEVWLRWGTRKGIVEREIWESRYISPTS